MTDAFETPERIDEDSAAEFEPSGIKKLAVLPTPVFAQRDRPVTNLGKVFGQFAELQQQIAEQVVTLEDSVQNQKADIAAAMAQLPELRERINWLIASFYEQSKKDETVRERLSRHDASIETILATVKNIESQQKQVLTAFDDMFTALSKARAAINPKYGD